MVQANSIAANNIAGTANIVKPSLVFHFRRKEITQRATKEHRRDTEEYFLRGALFLFSVGLCETDLGSTD